MPNLTSVGVTSGVPTSGTGTVSTLDAVIAVLPAALAANGGLKVEGVASGVAVPISVATIPSHAVTNAGTFATQSAATQSGTWTVQPGNTANTTAWKVDGSAVTQPVSLASVPSHAVTNAGTFATQAASTQSGTWTVQPGNTANTTAWKVDGSAVTQPISATALTNINTALGSTALDLGVGTGGSRTLRVAVDSSQVEGSAYETVAASQTNQVMGSTGAVGDYLSHVVVSPATSGCGVVTILDNATAVVSFVGGGTTALSNLIPFIIPVGITSTSGAWKITTGANVSCVAVGRFT